MTGTLPNNSIDAPDANETMAVEQEACFHCGEPCASDSFKRDEKTFCCNGCLAVHDILTQSGLGHFYDLNRAPGIRVRRPSKREQWGFLDEPELQQRLLDFTDGKQSRVTFHVPAIHCIACVWLLENLFCLHPGIGRSQVNFPRREVAIQFRSRTGDSPVTNQDPKMPEPHGQDARATIQLGELVALLSSIGYEPLLTLGELEKRNSGFAGKRQWLQVGVAGFAFGNIMLFSIPTYLGLDSISEDLFKAFFGWLGLLLALPVVSFSAWDYWKSAALSVRQRRPAIDVPIALGLAAIYGWSAYEIISKAGEGYCDSLTGLVFFLLCGRLFQQKTYERLTFDRDYKSFFPLSVTRRTGRDAFHRVPDLTVKGGDMVEHVPPAEKEEHISLSQLRVGDRIVIRNGELIPADTRLLSGPALIDYSFVTGESEPVAKNAGDYLYAGGRQIGTAIEVETVKPVSQSYLTSLWNHEAFLKDGRDNFETLTNGYSRRFTLIVISVAVGALLFWAGAGNLPRGISAFVSVLIVACPCALALAAPFTFGTAQRWLARMKVYLKNATVLERLARVDSVVFDKTGTLTSSGASLEFVLKNKPLTPALSPRERENCRLSLNETGTDGCSTDSGRSGSNQLLFPLPGGEGQGEGELTEREACWIFSLARHSTHPHSVRIAEWLCQKCRPESVQSFTETPGCGIEGKVDGHEILIGSRVWLESRGAFCSSRREEAQKFPYVGGYEGKGSTVHVAVDGRYRGAFVLSSALRPEIEQLICQLAGRYQLALVSGDNERERGRFRELFGHDAQLHFNQTPVDKLNFIRGLQRSGVTVMMVGDGLNDAGAFRQSDVAVAVVERVGAFSPASDVILDATCVGRLSDILALARRTARIVRVGFGISAAYNIAGIGIAAAGLLSPIICAVLMPLSSVSVVLFACGMTTWAARRMTAKVGVRNSQSELPSNFELRTSDLSTP
jgi:Cu+-exporting ATPase